MGLIWPWWALVEPGRPWCPNQNQGERSESLKSHHMEQLPFKLPEFPATDRRWQSEPPGERYIGLSSFQHTVCSSSSIRRRGDSTRLVGYCSESLWFWLAAKPCSLSWNVWLFFRHKVRRPFDSPRLRPWMILCRTGRRGRHLSLSLKANYYGSSVTVCKWRNPACLFLSLWNQEKWTFWNGKWKSFQSHLVLVSLWFCWSCGCVETNKRSGFTKDQTHHVKSAKCYWEVHSRWIVSLHVMAASVHLSLHAEYSSTTAVSITIVLCNALAGINHWLRAPPTSNPLHHPQWETPWATKQETAAAAAAS